MNPTRSDPAGTACSASSSGVRLLPLPDDDPGHQETGHEDERKTEDQEPAHGPEGSLPRFT